jgi:hypothetical protein
MHRNGETSSTDDQARPEDRFRSGTSDPAGPDDRQPGVTAADVTAGRNGDPLASGPGGDPVAAGLAGHPLTAVRDDDADAEPAESRGAEDEPAGAGFRGVPPAEGQWVAGQRGPGGAPTAVAKDASAAREQPDLPGPRESLGSSAEPGPLTGADPAGETDETGRPGPEAPASGAGRPGAGAGTAAAAGAGAPLLTGQAGLRERWLQIQSGFIDDPRASVTEAAGFVGEITSTIVTAVQERERGLRGAWDGNGDADTESLRNALREYRTFFELLTRL